MVEINEALLHKLTALPKDLVGEANECEMTVQGKETLGLSDSGSQVSSMSQSFFNENFEAEDLMPLDDLLHVTAAGGHDLPYHGYVLVDLAFGGKSYGDFPLLVVDDTAYNVRVPLLIGTNVLRKIKENLLSI